ncbi:MULTISPECIES: APC family permease [Actinomadura]|uniref:Amino acid permease n=1 Tax=Actinomadura litoris TaxID=2678616 RepID=A0A7K1KW09_9ACTN|nr:MULTISPECIES: APC family permease [Actinomadura]MBT2211474.1 APC family permease [Actinomadura sp. NEAU-AAG7]MUN36388.1 amino acid permease [Actinomadura litoris]
MAAPEVRPPAAADRPPVLHRGLRTVGALLIVLSAVTPASSVFIIAPGVITQAGTGAFLTFAAAGVVGIFMAFVYAELSSAYPLTGGEYAIVGRTLGRMPGFVVLGLILITQLLILAVIALGVGTYLGVVVDGLNGPVVAAVTVAAATVIAIFDIKVNAVVTGIFLAIEMLALLILSALGFLHVERSFTDLVAHPVVAADGSGVTAASAGLIAAATAVAIFAYNGYGSAVYFGEETHDARKAIARTILWALGITVAAELIPVTAVLLGAPDLDTLLHSDSMMEYFITERGGATLNKVISLAIALAILNAVIAIMLLTARLIFSSGRDGTWSPRVDKALTTLHPRFGTPWIATVIGGVFSAAACFLEEKFLLVVTGTSLVFVYGALCLAVIAGRRNGTTAHAGYRMPWFPVAPVAALLALVYVVYQNAKDPEVGRPSLFVALGVIAAASAYFALVLRRRGGWHLQGAADEEPAGEDPTG